MSHNYVNEFQDSMNEHANAQYKAIAPYVLENERMSSMRGEDRGYLRVWKRPPENPRENEWTKKTQFFDSWEITQDVFESMKTKEDVEIFIKISE